MRVPGDPPRGHRRGRRLPAPKGEPIGCADTLDAAWALVKDPGHRLAVDP